ncbi:MAG: DNA polymerase I [bacterium]|nr:DNA polymerase I [bacterium]
MVEASSGKPNKLYLVDGTAQLYRAYFALPGLTNDEGLPTHAVFGFTTMLRKLIKDERLAHIAVVFDVKGPVFRHEQFPEYKANRPPTPEDLNVQAPYAKEVCQALGVSVLERQGFEADDLIATHTRRALEDGWQVVVVSSDKDLFQLVGDSVTLLNPSKNLVLDPPGVETTFGVPPRRVRDVLGLMGDSVDNIPGVPGVGEKTAVSVVSTYGDLERVIERGERFGALYDARDAVLDALKRTEAESEAEAASVEAILSGIGAVERGVESLLEIEREEEFSERLAALRATLAETDVDAVRGAVGGPGKAAAKPLRTLKRELKAMDRGSSKKVWYAIRDHAEQARMSLELATLDDAVPVDETPADFEMRDPDRETALALFRSLGFKALVEELAAGEGGPGSAAQPQATPVDVRPLLERAELDSWVEVCRGAGELAVGIETDGAGPMRAGLVGLSLATHDDGAAYVPLTHEYLGVPAQLSLESVVQALAGLLADPAVKKTSHDLKTADIVLRRHGMPVAGWAMDTHVAAFLLNAGRTSYAVADLAEEYLGCGAPRREEVLGSGAKRLPLRELEVERAVDLAAVTTGLVARLGRALTARMEESELLEVYERIDGPLLPVLSRMERHGIRIDTEVLAGMSSEMERGLDDARAVIHRLAGKEFNVDSPKQMREVLFEDLGLKSKRKTAKSRVASTDAQTLEELAEQHEIARSILEYRELAKLKGTYVDALPGLVNPETGRVHTSYHPTGAATGRLSSSDPNLQNIPTRTTAGRRIRSAFVPDDGFVFLASDYSQIELRVLAHVTNDSGLIAAFEAGEDIHRYTASKVAGVALDLVTDGMRSRAKAVNFGILYGMSETRLAREQGMKRTDARRFIESYFERFGSVRGYIDGVREQALRDAAVRTLFGRVRYFPQLHQKVHRGIQEQAMRAAVNTTIQGTAADLMKLAMLRVDSALAGQGLRSRVLLQVHDELLLEVPRDEIDAAQELVRREMESVFELAVPLVVDQKVGESWFDVS